VGVHSHCPILALEASHVLCKRAAVRQLWLHYAEPASQSL